MAYQARSGRACFIKDRGMPPRTPGHDAAKQTLRIRRVNRLFRAGSLLPMTAQHRRLRPYSDGGSVVVTGNFSGRRIEGDGLRGDPPILVPA